MISNFVRDLRLFLQDLVDGGKRYQLWFMLGKRDVLAKYKRTILGPLWVPFGMIIVASFLGPLYTRVLNLNPSDYIPYLLLGFTSWYFLTGVVLEGLTAFVSNATAIKEIPCPRSIFIYRIIWRNLIIYLLNLSVFCLSLFVFDINLNTSSLLIIPGLILCLFNCLWISISLAFIQTRYRDIGPFISSMMRLAFFVTPVIWMSSRAGVPDYVMTYNPFYYFIELLRSPLLGVAPSIEIWVISLLMAVIGWLVAFRAYVRFNASLPMRL